MHACGQLTSGTLKANVRALRMQVRKYYEESDRKFEEAALHGNINNTVRACARCAGVKSAVKCRGLVALHFSWSTQVRIDVATFSRSPARIHACARRTWKGSQVGVTMVGPVGWAPVLAVAE